MLLIDHFKVCSGPGTDASDQALFIRNILIQVGNLAILLHGQELLVWHHARISKATNDHVSGMGLFILP